jgi:hypothetical protein
MLDHNQPDPSDRPSMKGSFNALLWLASIHSTAILPFLRTGFGQEAFRMNAAICALGLFFLGGASDSFLIYLALWFVAVARQRIKCDPTQHSRFLGFPAVAIRIPGFRSEKRAKAAECLLCMAVGVGLSALDPALGMFVFGGAFSLAIIEAATREMWRRETQSIRDAQILMAARTERFRGQRHDY